MSGFAMTARVSAILGVGVLSACALLPRSVQPGGGGTGIGYKTVSAKEPPSTLVAIDGTVCTATAPRYDKAKEGDRVWCGWRQRGVEDSPQPGRLPGVQSTVSSRGFGR